MNIRVEYLNMPTTCRALTVPSYNFYTICLNARHSAEQNKKSLEHELKHIKNGDYDKEGVNVDLIECFTHSKEEQR